MSRSGSISPRLFHSSALRTCLAVALAVTSSQALASEQYSQVKVMPELSGAAPHGSQAAPSAETASGPEPDAWSALMVGGGALAVTGVLVAIGGTGGDSGGGSASAPEDPEDGSGKAARLSQGAVHTSQDARSAALHRLKLFGGIEERSITTIDAGPFSITTGTRLAREAGLGGASYSHMSFGFSGDGYRMDVAMNPDVGRQLGVRELGFGRAALMDDGSFDQPHLASLEQGYGSSLALDLSDASALEVTAFSGNGAGSVMKSLADAPSLFGGAAEITLHSGDVGTMKVAVGAMAEEGSFLGHYADGRHGDDLSASTMFANLGTSVSLGDRTRLTLAASLGHSSFTHEGPSSARGDDIMTTSFGVGLAHQGLFEADDTLSLAVAQPLRIESGSLNMAVPAGMGTAYRSASLNPEPSGREINLQASYGFDLMDGVGASVGAMHRFDANHVKGAQETIGMMSVSFKF